MRILSFLMMITLVVGLVGCGGAQTKDSKDGKEQAKKKNEPAKLEDGKVALTSTNTKVEFVGTKEKKAKKHDGGFGDINGEIEYDMEKKALKSIMVNIMTESLYSDDKKLTTHLQSNDFFDVKKFPEAKFESTKIETEDEDAGQYKVTGKLTLHGETKEITFPATVTTKEEEKELKLESEFTIDRTNFGMKYDESKVDNEVTVKVMVGL
ncbi:MAG: YceI family protein [Gemmataceae bacterium]